jgi:hypothetical protein
MMAEQALIPEGFQRDQLPPSTSAELPGQAQGVFFTLELEIHDALLHKIEGWFEGRDEVVLVDYGKTDKEGFGYIMLEWEECEVDSLFLAILRDEPMVIDFTTYTRDIGEDEEEEG